ncbi:hypothetical protein NQ314_001104, partial [Rhamnusium bicolor]
MSDSGCSSPPPLKPPQCSNEDWNALEQIINAAVDNEPNFSEFHIDETSGQRNCEIVLDIMDVDEDYCVIKNTVLTNLTVDVQKNINNKCTIVADNSIPLTISNKDDREPNHVPEYFAPVIVPNINAAGDARIIEPDQENVPPGDYSEIEENAKKNTKKRLRNPKKWKQNIRKNKRQRGEEYENVKGQKVPKKSVKENICLSNEHCPFKCSRTISREEREQICTSFWKLNDEKKLHFYSKHIKRGAPRVTLQVCREYFLNTLNISKQRIYYFFKTNQNLSTEIARTPLQGKHPKKVISEEKKEEVRMHIKSFPSVESHYCRSSTKKTYLERNLNMTRMYDTIYNAVWHEFICGRAGVHLASALIRILKEIVRDNPQLERLILWSDSCVPQNKNSIMSFALQCFLKSKDCGKLQVIEQKFGEPGHGNVQEIDNAHSCIERYIRNMEIWSPLTLIRLLLNIPKSWKLKFKFIQMTVKDYLEYQLFSSRYSYNVIPYTKVKRLIYENSLNIIYQTSFEGTISNIKLRYTKRINLQKEVQLPEIVPQIPIKPAAISDQKKKHLMDMLPQMPDEERQFYLSILGNIKTST